MSRTLRACAVCAEHANIIQRLSRALLVALALSPPLHAEPPSVPVELTLADALRAAAEHNPALQGQAFELRALEGRRRQAALRPNPDLALELENFAGSGSTSGSDALESTLALSQLIELGGKRQARSSVAESGLDIARADDAMQRLDAQAEVARRFVRLVADQEQLAVARRTTELTEDFFDAVSARVKAARSPLAEQSRAGIALARARLDEARATRTLETSRRSLAATWGSTEPRFSVARADLQQLPAVAAFETLVARMASNPALTRYLSEQRLRESELDLARTARTPDITVAAGLRRFEETSDHAFVLSFSVPLPVADRNQGAIAESQARLDKLEFEREAVLLDSRTKLFEFYQALQQARAEAETLHAQIVPQARDALEQNEQGYERGRFSYLEVAEARRELIDAQRSQIEAAATYHLLIAEIERLTSEPLAEPEGNP